MIAPKLRRTGPPPTLKDIFPESKAVEIRATEGVKMKKEHQDNISAEIQSLVFGQKETHDFKFTHTLSQETTLILNNQSRLMGVFEMTLKAILKEESEEG